MTSNVAVSIDMSKLAGRSFDYDLTLTDETNNKPDVHLTFTLRLLGGPSSQRRRGLPHGGRVAARVLIAM